MLLQFKFCYYAFNRNRCSLWKLYIYTYFVYFSAFYRSNVFLRYREMFTPLEETRWISTEIVEFGCKIDYVISDMFIKKKRTLKGLKVSRHGTHIVVRIGTMSILHIL